MNSWEKVDCIFCKKPVENTFSSGDLHLNLLPPIHVVECPTCGLKYLSPRPGKKMRIELTKGIIPSELKPYSSQTANYAQVNQFRDHFFHDRLNQILQKFGSCKTEMRMLDIGASQGTFISEARKMDILAYGIEPSNECFLFKDKSISISQGFAEHLPFKNNSFDVVHANHVFEHFANPLDAAIECNRVLKPSGLLFIEVPNQLDNIMFLRDMILGKTPQRKRNIRSIHHLYFFSRKTIRSLLLHSGFSRIKVKDYYSWKSKGWRLPLSLVTRLIGVFIGGGDRLIATGYKKNT